MRYALKGILAGFLLLSSVGLFAQTTAKLSAYLVQPDDKDLFPVLIPAPDGLVYRIVRGPESQFHEVSRQEMQRLQLASAVFIKNPIFSGPQEDADPLYQAFANVGSDSGVSRSISISRSYSDLKEEILRYEESRLSPNSPWISNALKVKLSAGVFLAAIEDSQTDPISFLSQVFSGVDSEKRTLINSIFFSDQLRVLDSDVVSLRRSALNSEPSSIHFDFPISENQIFGKYLGPVVSLGYETRRMIQVEDLSFNIDSRSIILRPESNRFRVFLGTSETNFSGPIFDSGELVSEFTRALPKGYLYRKYPQITSGTVGGIDLQFDLALAPEVYDLPKRSDVAFWSFDSLVDSTFYIGFWDEKPNISLTINTTPHLTWSGVDVHEETQSYPLPESVRPAIEAPLRAMVTQALGGRYLKDSFGYEFNSQFDFEFGDVKKLKGRFRLEGFEILPDGIELSLGYQAQINQLDKCVQDRFEFSKAKKVESSSTAATNASEAKDSEDQGWGFKWKDSSWELYRSDLNQQNVDLYPFEKQLIDVDLSIDTLSIALQQAWGEGLLCLDTRVWEYRPSEVPLGKVNVTGLPRLELMSAGHYELFLPISLQMETDAGLEEVLTDETLSIDVVLHEDSFGLEFGDWKFIESELNASLNENERVFINRFSSIVLESLDLWSFESSMLNSLLTKMLPRYGIHFDTLTSSEKGFALQGEMNMESLFDTMAQAETKDQEASDTDLPLEGARGLVNGSAPSSVSVRTERPKLHTIFLEKPEPYVKVGKVDFKWGQKNDQVFSWGRVEYQHRMKKPGGSFEEWSLWKNATSYSAALSEEGTHAFQLRSRWASGEMERVGEGEEGLISVQAEFIFQPDRTQFNTLKPSKDDSPASQKDKTKSPGSEEVEPQTKNSEALPVFRASPKGPFGCSLVAGHK